MTTPMRSQYLAIKKQYPDVIVFFRLGDFYETFDDDAKLVSEVCDVVLTSRPVGLDQRVPLAGVPYHAVEVYVAKLINAGYKVAIAEQIGSEPPKGEKLVPRVVRRVVTPGTLVEPGLLSEKRNNYLAALVFDGLGADRSASGAPPRAGLAYADISTGEFAATEIGDGTDVRPPHPGGAGAPLARRAPLPGAGSALVRRTRNQGSGTRKSLPIPVPSHQSPA